jgi:hypothetical protein
MEELQKKYEAAIQLLANQLDTIFTLKARLEMAEAKLAEEPADNSMD